MDLKLNPVIEPRIENVCNRQTPVIFNTKLEIALKYQANNPVLKDAMQNFIAELLTLLGKEENSKLVRQHDIDSLK